MPAKGSDKACPARSKATAERRMSARLSGGTNKASVETSGVKSASRKSPVSWARLKGWPWPKGVVSSRAHSPRRFGAMTMIRPPGFSVCQISERSSLRIAGGLERVDDDHPVERSIAQGQHQRVDEGRGRRALARPDGDALRRRHQRDGALGLVAEDRRDRRWHNRRPRARSREDRARANEVAPTGCAAPPGRAGSHRRPGAG